MSDQPKKSNFFEKLATFIVDKRNLIFFLYAIAIIASLITQSWVKVCDDLTQYLPETTETRRGLTLMEDEMKTYGTARIIVSHVTYEIARDLADQIEDLNNISSVDFWDADKSADDTTLPSAANKTYEDYMQGADALITVTFRGENDDQSAKDGLAAVKELLAPYDFYIDSSVGDSQADSLADEMGIILAVAAVIIVLVLLLTSRSYAEVPVLLLTFVAAALLNKGTNFIFGEISFVSDSVTVVLQLALAIDYSIILLHRFLEERDALSTLPEVLQEAAAKRMQYPDLSLTALCGCFEPPVSKSGLSHRMKKLEALAENLRKNLEQEAQRERDQ